jgi:hypothetical protein
LTVRSVSADCTRITPGSCVNPVSGAYQVTTGKRVSRR